MSTVRPKNSKSSTIDSVDESYDLNGWWFDSELTDSNQATKSTQVEQNTEAENPSPKKQTNMMVGGLNQLQLKQRQ